MARMSPMPGPGEQNLDSSDSGSGSSTSNIEYTGGATGYYQNPDDYTSGGGSEQDSNQSFTDPQASQDFDYSEPTQTDIETGDGGSDRTIGGSQTQMPWQGGGPGDDNAPDNPDQSLEQAIGGTRNQQIGSNQSISFDTQLSQTGQNIGGNRPRGQTTVAPRADRGPSVGDSIAGAAETVGSGIASGAYAAADVTGDAADATWDYAVARKDEALEGVDYITGAPGEFERGLWEGSEDLAQPLIGAPGDIEEGTVGTVTGPPGEFEQGFWEGTEALSQPIIGPAGDIEQGVSESIAAGTGALADTGDAAATGTADIAGDLVAFGGASVAALASGDFAGDSAMDEAGDVFRGPEQEKSPETIGEQGAEMGVGAVAGVVNEVTFSLPENTLRLGAAGKEAAEYTGAEIEDEGVVAGTQSAAATGGTVGAAVVDQQLRGIISNPFESGIEAATGGRIAGIAEDLTTRARARVETRGEQGFDLSDTDAPEADRVGSRFFETDTGAPADVARDEIRRRATDQPESVQDVLGDSVLWRSDPTRGDFEDIGEGQSELPGLFTTPDAPKLRLDTGVDGGGTGSFTPRIPFLGGVTRPQRMAGFESPDVRTMPQSAADSGYAVYRGGEAVETGLGRGQARDIVDREGGTMLPDPTTSGYDFLTGEAEPGVAYTRPTGDRSPELEAVFAPDSEFVRTTTAGPVDIPGGSPGTADLYRRVTEGGDVEGTDLTRSDIPDQYINTGEDIISRSDPNRPSGQPVTPPLTGATGTTGGGSTGSQTTTTDPFNSSGSGATGYTGGITGYYTNPTQPTAGTTTGTTGTSGGSGSGGTTTGSTGGSTTGGSGSGTSGGPTDPSGIFTGTPTTTDDPTTSRPPIVSDPTITGPPPTTKDPTPTPPPVTEDPPPTGPPPTDDDPSQNIFRRGRDDDDESEGFNPFADADPTGETFQNPVASGTQFLFGGLGGSGGENDNDNGENPDPSGLFFG